MPPRPALRTGLAAAACLLLAVLFARTASADDDTPPARMNLAGVAGIADFHRTVQSPSSEGGVFIGATLRLHPTPMHGLFASFTTGEGVFGPSAATADAGYSLRLVGPRSLHGPSGAIYLDAGPAFAFVSGSGTSTHTTLGGRVGITAEARIAAVLIGLEAVYRGGLPVDTTQQWEDMLSVGLHLGFVFDLVAGHTPEDAR